MVQMQLLSTSGLIFTLLAAAAMPLDAAFIGPYDPSQFVLTNMNADGFAILMPNGSLVITGGNNGGGNPGTTTFLVSAAGSGQVTFNFSYSSLDAVLAEVAGYMRGSSFTQLADRDGFFGPVSFAVTSGQTFGFRIDTIDNQAEPGVLTISNFQAPLGASVPEPSTWLTAGLGLAAAIGGRRRGPIDKREEYRA